MEKLAFFHDYPAHRYNVAMDSVHYEVRLTYRERTASWYLDLWDPDGNALLLGKRLAPNWPVNMGITGGPPGLLVPFGFDPYDRHELELWYFTAAELEEAEAEEAELLPVELS
jgi:hypothetical protein